MKLICLLILSFQLFSASLSAQQNHFIFIQSENRQPFNVTLNKKVYSSTATGYVIIPKLASGQFDISIAFGGNTISDQDFRVEINKNDVGYTLKNLQDKGWGLFNLQTMEVTMSGKVSSPAIVASNTTSAETAISTQSNPAVEKTFQPDMGAEKPSADKTLGEKVVTTKQESIPAKVETPANEQPKAAVAESAPIQAKNVEGDKIPTEQKVVPTQVPVAGPSKNTAFVQGRITKISELKGGEAYYITYVDQPANDTINILIPNTKIITEDKAKDSSGPALRFLNIETSMKDTSKKVEVPVEMKAANTSTSPKNSLCTNVATDDDFIKLRKKMAASPDTDGMFTEARKYFKASCFSTLQVKNLAYLFLTDATRYQFFDMAYPYVTDADQFPVLAIMLSDNYYLKRFKAMLLN